MISKTHVSGQKQRGRQLNAKVCGSKRAIHFVLGCAFFTAVHAVMCNINPYSSTLALEITGTECEFIMTERVGHTGRQ